jgi:hypothetical protein
VVEQQVAHSANDSSMRERASTEATNGATPLTVHEDAFARLVDAINAKLLAHRVSVMKSLGHGKVSWRSAGVDDFNVELEIWL